MNKEERLEKEFTEALMHKTPNEALEAFRALWFAYPTRERTIAGARMIATSSLATGDVFATLNTLMEVREMLGGLDAHLLFCVKMAVAAYASAFREKTGKELYTYNYEPIYTTEDEFDSGFDMYKDFKEQPEEATNAIAKHLKGNVLGDWEELIELERDTWENHKEAFKLIYSVVHDNVIFNDGEKILDLGCGTMAMPLRLLLNYGTKDFELVGMDLRKHTITAALKFINENFPKVNCKVIHADAATTGIPTWFEPQEVDVVTTFDFIEHIRKKEYLELLKNVHYVLKDGGRFYISKPNGLRFLGRVEEKNMNEHVCEKSVGYLLKTLHEAGFDTNVKCRPRIVIEAIKKGQ